MMMGWRAHHHGLIIIATTLVNEPMRRSPGKGITGASRCFRIWTGYGEGMRTPIQPAC